MIYRNTLHRLCLAACVAFMFPLITNAIAADIPIWTYDSDDTGQEFCGSLAAEYANCEIGTHQSPITVAQTEIAEFPPLVSRYGRTNVNITNTGRGIITDVKDELTLESNGVTYTLKQIFIHSPSE